MKKSVVVLLVLSLLANLALAVVVVRTDAISRFARGSQKSAPAQARAKARPQASDSAIAAAVRAGDTKALLDLLKAAGLDDKTARFMTAGVEFQKIADQLIALQPERPYWRNNTPSSADRMKTLQVMIVAGSRMQELLADVIPQMNGNRYGYLTPERRAQLIALEKDYTELTAETLAASSDFRLQSDTDKLRDLAAERKREIDQFLTPDEIAARDLRESPAAHLLRDSYGAVIDNEAEYQAAYAIMQAAGGDVDAGRAQVEAMLGAERMTRLAQMNDPDYNLMQSAAARLGLPAEATTASLMSIRDQARQASEAIAADGALSSEQRAAALRDLAASSQQQMSAVLGEEGAAAFARSSRWMNSLKQGAGFNNSAGASKGKVRTRR